MELNRYEKTLLNLKKLHDNNIIIAYPKFYINGYHTEQQVENEENEDILNAKIVGLDLSGIDFGDISLESLEFYNCDFSNCEFSNAKFRDCTFIDCNFGQSIFFDVDITGVAFINCDLDDMAFTEYDLQNIKSTTDLNDNLIESFITNFTKIEGIKDLFNEDNEEGLDNPMAKTFEALQQLNLLGQNYFEHIIFDNDEKLKNKNIVIDIDLSKCHFDFINFTNIIFRDVNFIDTDFINSYFVNCIFKNCNFEGANFKRVHISDCFFW